MTVLGRRLATFSVPAMNMVGGAARTRFAFLRISDRHRCPARILKFCRRRSLAKRLVESSGIRDSNRPKGSKRLAFRAQVSFVQYRRVLRREIHRSIDIVSLFGLKARLGFGCPPSAMSRLAAEEASDGTIGLTQPVVYDGVGSYRGPSAAPHC
jgi:hypothetical protein